MPKKDSRYEPSPEGVLLRRLRVERDLPQLIIAERMGYKNGGVVGLAETGAWRPPKAYIAKFAATLGLSLAQEQQLLALRNQEYVHKLRATPVVFMEPADNIRNYYGDEEDEPLEDVLRAFHGGEHGLTAPPTAGS